MNIVIVGGGEVGTTLAAKLSGEGHDVSLVEHRAELAAELRAKLDVQVIHGNGATAEVLRRAGVAEAQLVVASTESDETNFITGRIAVSMFKVPHVVVRLREAAHEEAFHFLSRGDAVDVVCVNPEAEAVQKIAALLEVPGALDVDQFLDGQLWVAGFPIDANSEFAERPVSDMRLFFAETPALVAAIQRGDRALVPHGRAVIRAGDVAYFALTRADFPPFLEQLMGAHNSNARGVMVAGATRIGRALAQRLGAAGAPVTLLEADAARARAAAETLPKCVVVNGAATQQALLEEEDIERVGAFVAVTGDHEENLVSCLLAKRLGARRAFALVDNPALANLIGETAVDAAISPRLLAIGLALRHIPGSRVTSMAALLGDRVEVLEAEVGEGAAIARAPLAQLNLPEGVLVAALRREGKLLVPRGEDALQSGDRLVLVATTEQMPRVAGMLQAPGA